ncbi:hypothetical protein C8Q73DRAFT_466138 [Cubamyces lactineus]|nr:hypothetical protein C8Q73DRAFT_466138 [Cubamyces lactineus]
MAAVLRKRVSLDSVPPEVIEYILITAVAGGDAESVASVATTCKYLFEIVYETLDSHLWRSLFCTTFDDPRRLVLQVYASDAPLNWRRLFTERVRARRYVYRHAVPIALMENEDPAPRNIDILVQLPEINYEENIICLRALTSVIMTAASDMRKSTGAPLALTRTDRAGVSVPIDLAELHNQTGNWPPDNANGRAPSMNIPWLRETLARGLPSVVTGRFILQPVESLWHNSSVGSYMAELLSHLGFMPIPPGPATAHVEVQVPRGPSSPSRYLTRQSLRAWTGSSTSTLKPMDMSADAQWDRARWIAREMAFDMTYLSPRRNWGPYIPVHPMLDNEESEAETSDNDSDPDYVPGNDVSQTADVPSADQLRPDWSWLGAARIVADCVLRAYVNEDEGIGRLHDWENVREGAWVPTPPSTSEEEQANATDGVTSHERDWAGAEGLWSRLVCWFGYNNLFALNQGFMRYDDPDLDEAWIIVPLSLRITGYSPSPIARYADRPTIHVEGEMGGGNWEDDEEDVRRVHGTVSMLEDGHVRWSIVRPSRHSLVCSPELGDDSHGGGDLQTSMNEDNTEDEWASEAIQLGGVGSRMGSLGMWTGVNHEDDDPLGVIWQWRVG